MRGVSKTIFALKNLVNELHFAAVVAGGHQLQRDLREVGEQRERNGDQEVNSSPERVAV
jgi:hypothetical protein